MADTSKKLWGLLAQYETPRDIYKACERVRDGGFTKWDACAPFPVHGLDKAMGLKPSPLPWFVLIIGISGSLFALLFQVWAMGYDYPFVVGGKPFNSLPAWVPVWYEFSVLSSCLTIFFGNWIINGLPRMNHPAFDSKAFARVTDDKFFIMIEAEDGKFDRANTEALLKDTGATLVEELHQ